MIMAGFGDLDAVDDYLDGKLSLAASYLAEGKTVRLFELLRDASDLAGLKHEQTNGLLTPAAIADQARREAIGRQAAFHDDMARANGPQMTVNGREPTPAAAMGQGHGASPGCMRGAHRFGSLRGANGEAECLDCQTVFICPP